MLFIATSVQNNSVADNNWLITTFLATLCLYLITVISYTVNLIVRVI